MLQRLRKAGQGLIGKIVVAILFGLLIVSFAIWGIGDIFRGGYNTTVARVGGTDISAGQFRAAYTLETQRLSRQFRTTITPDQARLLGIDQRVLNRLIAEAVLDERARRMGLSASDSLVARSIMEDPSLQGPAGFDPRTFQRLLAEMGMSENQFVERQRQVVGRSHMAEALTGALPVPLAAREALHRYSAERRAADYVMLPASAAGEIPAPTQEQLQAFYNERKASFQAPEYRGVNVLVLTPATVMKPEAVSDADARQRYEQVKERFGTPERRTVQQIGFSTKEEAEAALKRMTEGLAFDALAAERNIPAQDLELGTFTKAEMLDPTVAETAFSLQEGGVAFVQSRFGPVLVRAAKVQPAAIRPFEEVAGEIKTALAQERARSELDTLHDSIEDMRASARPLADIAREKGLSLTEIPALDRQGRDPSGQPVALASQHQSLLPAVFSSDIGVDNEALRTQDGGYIWFDVTKIDPVRDRALDEVREEVSRQWRENEVAQRLSERARQLVERLGKGETIQAIAGELGVEAQSAADLARQGSAGGLPAEVVTRIFTTPVGQAASAPASADGRAVFKVTSATVPPMVTTTQEAQSLEEQFRASMADDLVAEFIAQAQSGVNITINQQAMEQAIAGGDRGMM